LFCRAEDGPPCRPCSMSIPDAPPSTTTEEQGPLNHRRVLGQLLSSRTHTGAGRPRTPCGGARKRFSPVDAPTPTRFSVSRPFARQGGSRRCRTAMSGFEGQARDKPTKHPPPGGVGFFLLPPWTSFPWFDYHAFSQRCSDRGLQPRALPKMIGSVGGGPQGPSNGGHSACCRRFPPRSVSQTGEPQSGSRTARTPLGRGSAGLMPAGLSAGWWWRCGASGRWWGSRL